MASWSNWAGNQAAQGVEVQRPRQVEQLAELVAAAARKGRRVKVLGSGHSFTPIGRPEDLAVELSQMAGIYTCDRGAQVATVGAGTTLRRLNELLAGAGLAMTNLGDIDSQTLGGALATGTHGTGSTFGGLSTQVLALEMVTPEGEVVSCSAAERPELFSAARVGLGALGIVTQVSLRLVPLFALRAEECPMPLDELLDRFDELNATYDHFEAYWFPHTRRTLTKRNTRLPLPEHLDRLARWREWVDDELLANALFGAVVGAGRRLPKLVPASNALAARAVGSRTFTDVSYRVFTSPRRVRFKEMELALPREAAVSALKELVRALESSDLKVGFPVEIRVAAADDIPLSSASGRQSVYFAFHVPAKSDHEPYFTLMAQVLDPYGYRPHWGKLHSLGAAELRGRYPRFEEFVRLRDELDPSGVFSNPYLAKVLGAPPRDHGTGDDEASSC